MLTQPLSGRCGGVRRGQPSPTHSDFLRKRNIHQAVAMHVPDFSPFEVISRPSEAVGARSHVSPALHGVINSFFRPGDSHTYLAAKLCLLLAAPHWMWMAKWQLQIPGNKKGRGE